MGDNRVSFSCVGDDFMIFLPSFLLMLKSYDLIFLC